MDIHEQDDGMELSAPEAASGLSGFGFTEPPQVMVNFDLDLTELPSGRYLATVKQLDLAFGKESGEPYFKATFVILEPEEYAGREVWSVLSFSPRALRWTVHRLSAIAGYDLPPETIDVADPAFRNQFIGRRVSLRIGSRVGFGGWPEPDVQAIAPAPELADRGEQQTSADPASGSVRSRLKLFNDSAEE